MSRVRFLMLIALLGVGFAIVVDAPRPALAATITVTTSADELGTGSACALREAIQAANTNAAFGGCPAGEAAVADEIRFDPSINGVPIVLGASAVTESSMRIVGNGTSQTIVDGNRAVIVLHITSGQVEIARLTVRRGLSPTLNRASGIQNDRSLTVTDCVITDNTAGASSSGAGISSVGALVVERSLISNNWAQFGNGGGVSITGIATIRNTIISGNLASSGAGISLISGALRLERSSVRGNIGSGIFTSPFAHFEGW